MSTSDARAWKTLAAALLVAAVVVAAADQVLAAMGRRHFLPHQKMRAAIGAGERCIVVLGDSRTEVAIDVRALQTELARNRTEVCTADIALGAVDLTGQMVALRQYLTARPRPRAVILGIAGDTLLRPRRPMTLSEVVGNRAVILIWSRAADVFAHYPRFPVDDLDSGLRFVATRATAFGRYGSLVWMRVQRWQDTLTGRPPAQGPFGRPEDMDGLRRRLEEDVVAQLEGSSGEWRHHTWLEDQGAELARRGVPLILVELPMPPRFRGVVAASPGARDYRLWLTKWIAQRGAYVDLSSLPFADDAFIDGLHLTPDAARTTTRALARELLTLQKRRVF